MAVREFDGSDDDIQVAIGTLDGMSHGTVAVIVKRTALLGFDALFVTHTSGGTRRLQVSFVGNETNWYPGSGPTDSRGPLVNNTADWWLVIARKPTGTVAPRYSVYNFGSVAWVHADGANALPDSATPSAGGTVRFTMQGGEHLAARVAVRAAWSNTLPWAADAAGDAAIEAAGLELAAANWQAASPDAGWLFNQADVGTQVTDFTGGGADQTGITGTTVVTGDDPPGFSFDLGTTVALGAAAEADAARSLAVSKAASPGPATASDQGRPVTAIKRAAVGAAGEADGAQPMTVVLVHHLSPARTTDSARPMVARKVAVLGPAREADQALALTGPPVGAITIPPPDTGTITRPDTGTTLRPDTGVISRPTTTWPP